VEPVIQVVGVVIECRACGTFNATES